MNPFATSIRHAAEHSLGYGKRLLTDVPPETFARLPLLGERHVQTNHGAFIYGHLSLYPSRVLELLGHDPSPAAYPPEWRELCGAGAACEDDADGTRYPAMEAIVENYERGYTLAIEAVAGATDAVLTAEMPDERYRSFFPTVGVAVLFLLNNHPSVHHGQMSAWRRCIGLGPAPMGP